MKKLLLAAALLFATPTFAHSETVVKPKNYRPFRYETPCVLEYNNETYSDVCVVIETRENTGALRTRNIFSNRHALTIKSWFDNKKGFMTWDSHNKFEYQWDYKPAGTGWTYVMPGFLVENVSWD